MIVSNAQRDPIGRDYPAGRLAASDELAPGATLSYPCSIEHAGKLYVGYSNRGGRGGNHNSAELAIIPLGALRID